MQHYINAFKNYAKFAGRARRQEYWMFALFHGIVILALYGLALFAGLVLDGTVPDAVIGALILPFFLYALASFVPALAVCVRRLHDTNREGAWFFIAFIPLGVGAVFMMIFMCSDGNPHPNRFGPDPKGRNEFTPQYPGHPYAPQQMPYPQPAPMPAQRQPGQPFTPYPQQPAAHPYPQQPPGAYPPPQAGPRY